MPKKLTISPVRTRLRKSKASATSALFEKIKAIRPRTMYFVLLLAMVTFLAIGAGITYLVIRHPVKDPGGGESSQYQLISQVGSLLELPPEEPTIATVTNLKKLEGQLFFVHAELGDKVLLYEKARKVILYRPSAHKVIEVAELGGSNQ